LQILFHKILCNVVNNQHFVSNTIFAAFSAPHFKGKKQNKCFVDLH